MAVRAAKRWGQCMFIGGYGEVLLKPSPWILQKQLTLRGSWTFSVNEMQQLCQDLEEWQLHPDSLISHTYPIEKAAEALDVFDKGIANKVAIVYE